MDTAFTAARSLPKIVVKDENAPAARTRAAKQRPLTPGAGRSPLTTPATDKRRTISGDLLTPVAPAKPAKASAVNLGAASPSLWA